MNHRAFKAMLATLLCLGAMAAPALAQFNISIDIGTPPPAHRYEVVQELRPGYVLVPGFWFWDGHRHRWAKAHWVEARPGHHWAEAHWEQRGRRHHFEPGRWEPDHREDLDERRGHEDRERPGREHPGQGHREGNGRF